MPVSYIVRARAGKRTLSMGTRSAVDALLCANEFLASGKMVTIADEDGMVHSVDAFKARLREADPDREIP